MDPESCKLCGQHVPSPRDVDQGRGQAAQAVASWLYNDPPPRVAPADTRAELEGAESVGTSSLEPLPATTDTEVPFDAIAYLESELQRRLLHQFNTVSALAELAQLARQLEEAKQCRDRQRKTLEAMSDIADKFGPAILKWTASLPPPDHATIVAALCERANAAIEALASDDELIGRSNDSNFVVWLIRSYVGRSANGEFSAAPDVLVRYDAVVDALCRLRLALRERETAEKP